ncbi:MAG: CotH kinase family protein [Deltaproteobacteria bacterium]|nr:CotH kinase family protein [Deltaproteobacteria bacterium]
MLLQIYDSPLYDNTPLSINRTTELRAQVFVAGIPIGKPYTAVYIASTIDVNIDLPIIVLDNFGAGQLSTENREFVPAIIMSFSLNNGKASLSSTPEVATRAGIHIRGQSSASFEKTPYRVEFWDDNNEDQDIAILGMPAESDWVLRGPYADKALVRDAIAYDFGCDMGMQAPRYVFCELYVNVNSRPLNEDDYMGVYLLVETIKNAKRRLDLKQLRENDVTLPDIMGGYIIKFEWKIDKYDEPMLNCFSSSNCWNYLLIHDPNPIASQQLNWILNYIHEFNDSLYSPTFADETVGYHAYINVESFVDQIIINELTRELDSYIRSAYFDKDRYTKLFAGPLWDYNLIFGVGGYFNNEKTSGWQYEQIRQDHANYWIPKLLTDPAFFNRVVARWKVLRQGLLSDNALDQRIAELTEPLADGAKRNFKRWPNFSSEYIYIFKTPTNNTWEGQVGYMRDWLIQRAAWLDTQWKQNLINYCFSSK